MLGGCSRSIEPREFPLEISPTRLCTSVTSYRAHFEHIYGHERELNSTQVSTYAFHNRAAFRTVIPLLDFAPFLFLSQRMRVSIPFQYYCTSLSPVIGIPLPWAPVYPGQRERERENRGFESRGLEERTISLAGFVTRNWTRGSDK